MSNGNDAATSNASAGTPQRAVPYACPYCAEENLFPLPKGSWHCRSCLRAFAVKFHGLLSVEQARTWGDE